MVNFFSFIRTQNLFVVPQEVFDPTVCAPSHMFPPCSEEDELLGALQLKAEAFANKNWNEYWKSHGPSLLAGGWVNTHPLVPLRRVEEVCAIDFLSSAMTQIDLTLGAETTTGATLGSHDDTTLGSHDDNTLGSHDDNTLGSHDDNTLGSHVDNTLGSYDDSQGVLSTYVQNDTTEAFFSSPQSASSQMGSADDHGVAYGPVPKQEESSDTSEHTSGKDKACPSPPTLPEGKFVLVGSLYMPYLMYMHART